MDSIPAAEVECECETMAKPVDFLGDSVCKSPSANVREIIRKYEPDRELLEQTGALGSVSNQRTLTKTLNRVIFEETESNTMRAMTQQSPPKQVFTKSVEKSKGIGGKRSLGMLAKNANTVNISKRSHSEMRSSGTLSESTYKSKTTITRTSQGVRITTDILFSSSATPEQWAGRRIDTDLPNSKILSDFEFKNTLGK